MKGLGSKFRGVSLVFRYHGSTSSAKQAACATLGTWETATRENIYSHFGADAKLCKHFLHLLDQGHSGLFLLGPKGWISYGWISHPGNRPPHLPRWISRLGAYWIFYCHTKQTYRGQGCYKSSLTRLSQLILNTTPTATIFIDTEPENAASRRAILSSGFSPGGIVITYKLWIPRVREWPLGGRWLRGDSHPTGTAPERTEHNRDV
jgi:hypothetical protein